MPRRPSLWPACVVYSGLGLLVGLTAARSLARYPLERLGSFDHFPRPRSMDWIVGLKQATRVVDAWERPLSALIVLLLIYGVGLLGPLFSEQFQLVQPPDENPGRGASAHLDVKRLIRAALAVFGSFWLMGLFSPLGAYLPQIGPARVGRLFLGGLPLWTAGLPGPARYLLLALLLCVLLWLIWGPGGPVSPTAKAERPSRLAWGIGAGVAALPAVAALLDGRAWLQGAAPAFSLADRGGWQLLLGLALLMPAAAGAYLALVAFLFRPRPMARPAAIQFAIFAAVGALLTGPAVAVAKTTLGQLDSETVGLAKTLGLSASPLPRMAALLVPDGRVLYSRTTDGTDDGRGQDPIACNGSTVQAVERFVAARRYRSHQMFRAFIHLHDCAAIDWLISRSLELDLEFLERAPSPVAAEVLLAKLADCPTTPEHRRILDQVADPKRFAWSEPDRSRWLGAAYRHFGDSGKALEYLRAAKLSSQEFRSAMGGIEPLVAGTVRGTMQLVGKPADGARIGLVRAGKLRELVGICRPFAWRQVAASTYADKLGRYEFRNIPEGDYVLITTWSSIGRLQGRPVAVGHPGVIQINRFRPEVTLPPVDLRFEKPTRTRPIPRDGTTTA